MSESCGWYKQRTHQQLDPGTCTAHTPLCVYECVGVYSFLLTLRYEKAAYHVEKLRFVASRVAIQRGVSTCTATVFALHAHGNMVVLTTTRAGKPVSEGVLPRAAAVRKSHNPA